MLQEVLVALSGHPTALFLDDAPNGALVNPAFDDLSAAEVALLNRLGRLAVLHRRVKKDTAELSSSHPSTIVRAVASSILHIHLRRFQDKILEVEKRILKNDSTLVGAYKDVPLSAVATEFDEWHRPLRWYSNLASSLRSGAIPDSIHDASVGSTLLNGPQLIDYLREQAQTGYSDIETVATQLSIVAETTWLKLLSSWVLYGKLPEQGKQDLFVAASLDTNKDQHEVFDVETALVPSMVDLSAASSILFIGKTLYQLRNYQPVTTATDSSNTNPDMLIHHTKILKQLQLPLSAVSLAQAIAFIRRSLSRQVLQQLLPAEKAEQALHLLHDFFLLGKGEFATYLLSGTGALAQAKQQKAGQRPDLVASVRKMVVQDGDLFETLNRAFKNLILLQDDPDQEAYLEFARSIVRLQPVHTTKRDVYQKTTPRRADDWLCSKFYDVLLPSKIVLTLSIPRPMDLFLSDTDVRTYGSINSYLLALRQTHQRLADLWRLSSARRGSTSRPQRDQQQLYADATLRKTWATCSSALFLTSELMSYLEGEVISQSWNRFFAWVTAASSTTASPMETLSQNDNPPQQAADRIVPHDPETLALAHRSYLGQLVSALLIDDDKFTTALRQLMTDVFALTSLFERLISLHHIRSLRDASGDEDTALELDRARKLTDSDMRTIVRRLREIDVERSVGITYSTEPDPTDLDFNSQEGSPSQRPDLSRAGWMNVGTGVQRLLMKLDFGRIDVD